MKKIFIIDFDSTFVQCEALEELARISLAGSPDRLTIINQIKKITAAGMGGRISFEESLSRRLKLIKANKNHIEQTAKLIKNKITPSFWHHRNFIKKNKNRIYIISGGFRELTLPTVSLFNIDVNHVLANEFAYDKNGSIVGCDEKNPLTKTGGKAKAVARLRLRRLHPGDVIWAIGDGYTDYEIRKLGAADYFIAYTENVRRQAVVKKADYEVKNFKEICNLFLS